MYEPTRATLRKYGLTIDEYRRMAEAQQHVCYVCGRLPDSGRLCIDHEHAPGWKRMVPDKRVQYVRGLLCTMCNYRLLPRAMTLPRARRIAQYLQEYSERRHQPCPSPPSSACKAA